MQDNQDSLISLINAWGGGAASTIIGTIVGRLMWHSNEARKGRRKFIGKELLWELPVALGMGLIGESCASYFGLQQPVTTGVIVTVAYMGPRGVEVMFEKWLARKSG